MALHCRERLKGRAEVCQQNLSFKSVSMDVFLGVLETWHLLACGHLDSHLVWHDCDGCVMILRLRGLSLGTGIGEDARNVSPLQ